MTITPRVRHELSPHAEIHDALAASAAARLDASRLRAMPTDVLRPVVTPPNSRWSAWEHERFLEALELYPAGPWSHIAWHIGSKTARQVMTHAQKYRQKLQRHQRREEALKRLEEARLAAEASNTAATTSAPARGLAETEAEEDALLSVIVEAVLAQAPAPAVGSRERQTSNAPIAASNEPPASHNDVVLEDLLRWTDQFFASFAPTSTEFDPLQ